MKRKTRIFLLTGIVFLCTVMPAMAELTSLAKRFSNAMIVDDTKKMERIVVTNLAAIPDEVEAILESARAENLTDEDRNALFQMGEQMAVIYMENSGETRLLKDVKQDRFESKLGERVRSKRQGGTHIIKIPSIDHKGTVHTFDPDNILIKRGETVVWMNEDSHSHVFASMAIIGEGGIFAPSIEPKGSWKYRFRKPGEYYYVCFIHKGMIGKITVR